MSEFHWKNSGFKIPPAGMREAILRVSYMSSFSRRQTASQKGFTSMKLAAEWSLGIGCTKEQWFELLEVCGITPRQIDKVA